jgi:hypothetical protein
MRALLTLRHTFRGTDAILVFMQALDVAFELDRRWHWLRGEMEETKKPALMGVVRVLTEAGIAHAIIGGIAMQLRQDEPRTTLDIHIAVLDRAELPKAALEAAGFVHTGSFPHPDNWMGPGKTPVQFTSDPVLHEAIGRAESIPLEGVTLRVLMAADLLHAKLRAAGDPARRRSKRILDLADAHSLIEREPGLAEGSSEKERALLESAGVLP